MAQTWRGNGAGVLASLPALTKREGTAPAISYSLLRRAGVSLWRVGFGTDVPLTAPVESVLGGSRHGYSMLARLTSVGGAKLERAPLVETRYLLAPDGTLAFSPGHSPDKPGSWETAVGRVLSSSTEKRCLTCHAEPSNGVQCAQCHGASSNHSEIANLAKLSNAARIAQCGQCHADGRELADPMPEDLLIASQADALVRSECYIQSGQGFNCSSCHDPHKDSAASDAQPVAVCLSCHGTGAGPQAVTCPVNPNGKCIGCHMPSRPRDSFRMVDHWIRVSLDNNSATPTAQKPSLRRAFLRMILMSTRAQAEDVFAHLNQGGSFAEAARHYSKDPSAASGGYIGAMSFDQMDPVLWKAVSSLQYAERSGIVQTSAGFFLFERQPRDFRWRSNALFLQASELKSKGNLIAAMEKNRQALEIYPTLLRALLFLGVAAGERNDVPGAINALETAARLYPRDPGTQLNLGIAYGSAGRTGEEITAYQHALEGEPDLVSARLNLGTAYWSNGRIEDAEQQYREAIQANPLSAAAYYNLSLVYRQQGKNVQARDAAKVATAIDSRFAKATKP